MVCPEIDGVSTSPVTYSVLGLRVLAYVFFGGTRMKYKHGGLAVSVALFLGAWSAQAQIVFSGNQHLVIARSDYRVQPTSTSTDPEALKLDLNGDGVADFSLFTQKLVPIPAGPIAFGFRGLNGSQYEGPSSSSLDTLGAGVSLGTGPQWSTGSGGFPVNPGQNWWGNNFYGYFNATQAPVSYVGLKLFFGGGLHFGWLAYELPLGLDSPLTIEGWAYQSAVGAPILTGDQGVVTTPVPEPSTYGVLGALAMLGLVWTRRSRRARGAQVQPVALE